MSTTTIKIKLLDHALDLPLPSYATEGSAGMDLLAAIEKDVLIRPESPPILVPTGIAIKLRSGYEAQVRSRSGLTINNGIVVSNSPGTIDSDYTGEIKVILHNIGVDTFQLKRGQKIAQLVIAKYCTANWDRVDALSDTKRGSNGFGSTGI